METSLVLEEGDPSTGGGSGVKRLPAGLKKHQFFQSLRIQLCEQMRLLETRLEAQIAMTTELHEYFKKRAEIETDVGKTLDKVHRKELNPRVSNRKGDWVPGTLSNVMTHLINETRKEAKERTVLGEICSQICVRLALVVEDLQRVFKIVQCVCVDGQEELLRVFQELYSASKAFSQQSLERKLAETKLRAVEAQKEKAETGLSKEKIEKSKKIKSFEKDVLKRTLWYKESVYLELKAQNEYILCREAGSAALQKYFVDDLSDLIDCSDLGYYESLGGALGLYVASEEVKKDSISNNVEMLNKLLRGLDTRVDKQKFLETNTVFVLPKTNLTIFIEPDMDCEKERLMDLSTLPTLREDLECRFSQLERRLSTLRIESNELWKTLELAEKNLLALISDGDNVDKVKDWFVGNSSKDITASCLGGKARAGRAELEAFHIAKYRDYMLSTNRISRLEAKSEKIRKSLGLSERVSPEKKPSENVLRRKRIGYKHSAKLFGGSIEEYLNAYKVSIPLVLRSCVRVVNLYGLHHQGIFRVSGSQVEINNFKDAFERGEDPLSGMTADNASDINSVASLLKLYLRELREPLFPTVFFDVFMEMAKLDNAQEFIQKMRDLVTRSLPRPIFIVLRYLFYFLNHMSEYSDENLMDNYNLAICFGPTLIPVPEDKDQKIQFQNLVNELIKNVIQNAHEIFENDGDEVYDRFGFRNEDEDEREESLAELEDPPQIPEEDCLEATASYDFSARSPRELSFKKGQSLRLYSKVSSDWWKGNIQGGPTGLVPNQYVTLSHSSETLEVKSSRARTVSETFSRASPVIHQRSLSVDSNRELNQIPQPSTSQMATAEPSLPPTELPPQPSPDLVMDLPERSDSDEAESSAEVFGSQNQSTLKKAKPQVKVKPQLMSKPQKKPPIEDTFKEED